MFACPYCPAGFWMASTLRLHVSTMHSPTDSGDTEGTTT